MVLVLVEAATIIRHCFASCMTRPQCADLALCGFCDAPRSKKTPISKNTLFFKPQIKTKLQNNLYLLDLLYGETLS